MYDYDEMYYGYLPDEVAVKINEIIKEELNNRLGSDLEELDKLRRSDKELRNKIYELQREVKKTQEEYDKKLKIVLLEKEKETKRKIFQGFTIGDQVYVIQGTYVYTNCQTCNKGKVKVVINNIEEEIKCPHCNGVGQTSKWVSFVYRGKISEINFQTWHDESDKCTESKFHIKLTDGKDCLQRNVKDIFLTEEEAIKECELRNQK